MNPTITKLAWKALAGRRSFLLLVLFPVALVALTVLIRLLSGEPEIAGATLVGLGFTLVLPLLALVSATAVMGPEVDDGSIVYLLAKPVSRHVVAVSKYAVAAGATVVFGALPMVLVGLVVEDRSLGRWLTVGVAAAFCAAVYCGLFLALSTVWRHAVVASLLFVLVWESVLANVFSGVGWLSVQVWARRLAAALHESFGTPDIPLWWALVAGAVVAVGGVWFSGDRLRSFALRGDE